MKNVFHAFLVRGGGARRVSGPLQTQAPTSCAPTTESSSCAAWRPLKIRRLPGDRVGRRGRVLGQGAAFASCRIEDRFKVLAWAAEQVLDRFDTKPRVALVPGPPDASTKAKLPDTRRQPRSRTNSVTGLFAVLHGGRESVEVFDVDARPDTPTLTWIECAGAPEPNRSQLESVDRLTAGSLPVTSWRAPAVRTSRP